MGLYALLQKTAAEVANAQKLATPSTAENKSSQEAPSREQPKEAPAEHGTGISGMQAWFRPKPHQEKAVRRLIENDGKLLIAHGMGSGKGATAVYGVETLRSLGKANKTLVVVPAGLRENFIDSAIGKFTDRKAVVARTLAQLDPSADYNVVSYEMLRDAPEKIMEITGADTLIADEYHQIRNEKSSTFAGLMRARAYVKNAVAITASPVNNRPEELGPLISVLENNPNFTRGDFKQKFVQRVGSVEGFTGTDKQLYGIKNPRQFALSVYPYIDYASSEDLVGKDLPKKKVTNVYVPMSGEQYRGYQLSLGRLGPLAALIARRDQHVTAGKAEQVFAQIGEARQIANSVAAARDDVTVEQSADRTPKARRIIGDTVQHLSEKPDNSVILYSNLIRGGADVLSAGLNKAGIPHAMFIGAGTEVGDKTITETTRQQGVKDFQDGKVKAIIVTGAGNFGLNLPNATGFFAYDGHFNPERILQAEARGRRLGGQAHRPPEQRVLDVRRYQSVIPQAAQPGPVMSFLGKDRDRSTDEWVYDTAAQKYKANQQFMDVLRKPHKYLRKVTDPVTQKTRYIYKEDAPRQTFWGAVTGQQVPRVEMP